MGATDGTALKGPWVRFRSAGCSGFHVVSVRPVAIGPGRERASAVEPARRLGRITTNRTGTLHTTNQKVGCSNQPGRTENSRPETRRVLIRPPTGRLSVLSGHAEHGEVSDARRRRPLRQRSRRDCDGDPVINWGRRTRRTNGPGEGRVVFRRRSLPRCGRGSRPGTHHHDRDHDPVGRDQICLQSLLERVGLDLGFRRDPRLL